MGTLLAGDLASLTLVDETSCVELGKLEAAMPPAPPGSAVHVEVTPDEVGEPASISVSVAVPGSEKDVADLRRRIEISRAECADIADLLAAMIRRHYAALPTTVWESADAAPEYPAPAPVVVDAALDAGA